MNRMGHNSQVVMAVLGIHVLARNQILVVQAAATRYILYQDLVLRPSCIHENMGVNKKNDIPV
jgi:hypothetical protein